jgi:surface carbohydrate biosynthesis protein (TIGR04326 family)
LRRALKRFTPAGIAVSAFRTFSIWRRTREYRPKLNSGEPHLVIASIAHPRSFSEQGTYKDAYFGPLVDHLARSNQKSLVLAILLEQPFEQIKKLRFLEDGVPVVPLEACLTVRDFIACAGRALWAYVRPVRPQGSVTIDGLDLSCLLGRAIRDTRHSGDIFMSLRVFYCGKWLARNIQVARCLYPYENRAWEKMLLQGMRSSSPQTQFLGYQHASITLSHTNFILADGESAITPLPDAVLTTGNVAKRWLEKEGKYPTGFFRNACALRQGRPEKDAGMVRRDRLTHVLVALGLGTGELEYPRILHFLKKAFAEGSSYDVRVRPHPGTSLDSVIDLAPLEQPDFFTPSQGSLAEDLQWADVTLYASSTVGLEAMSLGIPVIYLDLGDILDTDHMTGSNELRWTVEDAGQLAKVLRRIEDLSEDEFQFRQKNGQEYAKSYLEPVTAGGLQKFLE